jgi:HprK-related kinase A
MISDLSGSEFAERLRVGELAFCCGPFVVRVASPIGLIGEGLRLLYSDYALSEGFADFRLDLAPRAGLRRWLRPQVIFTADGHQPFAAFPLDQAYPLFEWSLNWCVASATQQYLIIHAAVVERDGRALIMPGPPGAGKSTLAAALVNRGWRLFSDEMTLIDIGDRSIVPLTRPISLKDRSIDAIRRFAPDAVFNAPTHNTAKGTISHMKAPSDHVRRAHETARAGWVVFPKYVAGAPAKLVPHSKPDAVLELATNSFNYRAQGRTGFEVLCDVVDASACYDFEYGALDEAIAVFERLRSREAA